MAVLLRQFFKSLSNIPLKQTINNEVIISRSALINSYFIKNIQFKSYSNTSVPYEIVDSQEEQRKNQDIINKVNEEIANRREGRLFAVVHVAGKQFKITEGDVIIVEGYWPPNAGDKINLDKIMLVGGLNFTLIGRPIVQRNLAQIEATVIEKTLSHTKTHFRKKRRKQYTRIHFVRTPQTMLRINKIEIIGEINNPPEVSESHTRSFQ